MLTPVDLTAMRAQQAAALPDTATLYRKTRSVDDTGGVIVVRAAVVTVACRVTRDRPREVAQGAQAVLLADWIVTLPYDTDVQPDDDIETGGRTLRCVGLLSASWRTCERALCTG